MAARRPASAPVGGRAAARGVSREGLAHTAPAFLDGEAPKDPVLLDQGRLTVLSGYTASPKWSLKGRFGSNRDSEVDYRPGPGEYFIELPLSGPSGHSFGPRTPHIGHFGLKTKEVGRTATPKCDTPGPKYNLRPAQIPIQRGGLIGRRLRPPGERESMDKPGPGEYKLPSTLKNKPLRFAGPGRSRPSSAPPGPPLYYEPPRALTPRAWSFGTGTRPPIHGGVGTNGCDEQYLLPSTLGGNAAFLRTASAPPDSSDFEVRPDPGAYTHRSALSGRSTSFGIGSRPSSAPPRTSGSPLGPGHYGVAQHKPASGCPGSASLRARSERSDLAVTGKGVPGPGKYPVSQSVAGPAYHFGRAMRQAASSTVVRSERDARHLAVLEEAAAMAKETAADVESSSPVRPPCTRFPARRTGGHSRGLPLAGVRDGPGPGAHHVKCTFGSSKRGCKFGTEERMKRTKSDSALIPGPGEYDLSKAAAIQPCREVKIKRGSFKLRPRPQGPGLGKVYSSFG